MHSVGFELAIQSVERLQMYSLDRAATRIDLRLVWGAVCLTDFVELDKVGYDY
jgi:hypothetical protein